MDNNRRHDPEHTGKQRTARACRRHLKDLILAHGQPPAGIDLKPVPIPRRIEPAPPSSYCTSPAELWLEIGE